MKHIEEKFNKTFENWQITLPQKDFETRNRGEISKGGWYIQYLFGTNEKGNYLDYYANHRMTNPRHRRIYESGEAESLPVPMESFSYDPDIEGDEERAEQEFFEYNRKVSKELENKGFV